MKKTTIRGLGLLLAAGPLVIGFDNEGDEDGAGVGDEAGNEGDLEAAGADEQGEQPGDGEGEPEGEEGKAKKNRPGRRERRLMRLSKTNQTLAQELEQERQARERLEQENAALKNGKPAADADPRPRREDFDDPDDFEEAKDRWLIRQARGGQQDKPPASSPGDGKPPQLTAADRARIERVGDITEAGEERHKDYREVIGKVPPQHFTVDMVDAIGAVEAEGEQLDDDELAADVAYYIGQNPKIAEELSNLKGHRLAARVGRIAAGLESGALKPAAAAKKPSGAPKPIKPVGGGDSKTRDLNKVKSIDEWMTQRNAQVAEAAKR